MSFMEVMRFQDHAHHAKPMFVGYIRNLGFTAEQARLFAEGYVAAVQEQLPLDQQEAALVKQHPECMMAAFRAAGIDEDDVRRRSGHGDEPPPY